MTTDHEREKQQAEERLRALESRVGAHAQVTKITKLVAAREAVERLQKVERQARFLQRRHGESS
jgi:hypothetical protein